MIERADAEKLRKIGRIGQIDEDDPSFLFRIADYIDAAANGGLLPDEDGGVIISAEQAARDILERMGILDAQSFSAGDVTELANLIHAAWAIDRPRQLT